MTKNYRVITVHFSPDLWPTVTYCDFCRKQLKEPPSPLFIQGDKVRTHLICRKCRQELVEKIVNSEGLKVYDLRLLSKGINYGICFLCSDPVRYGVNIVFPAVKTSTHYTTIDDTAYLIDERTMFTIYLCDDHTKAIMSASNFVDYIKGEAGNA
jgi:hypothetical protein